MKLQSLGQGLFSRGAPASGGFSRGFTAAPKPTVHPAMASQPGMYGGPPGSFIVSGACPPGYMRSPMPRGAGQSQQYRCIPRVAAPAPPRPAPAPPPVQVEVSPSIDVSPAIQTQVSPQISPVMTMQQDSPGAAVTAAPQQTGAPQTAATGPGGAPSGESEATERLRQQLAEERAAKEDRQAENLLRLFAFLQPQPAPQAAPVPRAEPAPAPMPAPMPEPRVMRTLAPTERDTSFLDRQPQPVPVAPEKGLNMGLVLLAVAAGLLLLKSKGEKNVSRSSTR